MRSTLLLFIFFTIILSRISAENKNRDEVRKEVTRLIEIAENVLEKSPDSAFVYAEQALSIAKSSELTDLLPRGHFLRGKALVAKNDFEKALVELKAAMAFDTEENSLFTGQNLYEQGFSYYRLGNTGNAISYLEKAIETFNPSTHIFEIALAEWRLALAFWRQGNYIDGLSHVQKSQMLFEQLEDKKHMVSVYNSKGAILWGLASYEKALEFFFDALSINEKENVHPDLNIILLNNIGLVYHNWEDYENAMKYFSRAEALIPESKHPVGDAYTWLNIGTLFLRQEKTDTALVFLQKARDGYADDDDLNGVCLSKIRIGECYQQNGELKLAEQTFTDAINDSKKTQNKHREANAVYSLAQNNLLQNNLDDALKNSLKALGISENGQYKDITSLLYEQLSEIYKKQGKSSLALEMLSKAMAIKDEIYREKIAVQYNLMELTYENELKETENLRLKSENLLKQRSLYFMYAAIFLVVIGFLTISVFNFKLKKKKKELQEANHAKDKIFSIVAHDLRSPVGTLNSMIDVLVEDNHGFDYKEILNQFKPVVAGSFDMLENLLVWAKANLGKLETSPVTLSLNQTINETIALMANFSQEKSIEIWFYPEHDIEVRADKIMLETVIRNLLKNAIKFTPENGKIEIVTLIKNSHAQVSIIDNGVGIPSEKQKFILKGAYNTNGTQNEKGSGIGLMLSKELAEKNGGKLWFSSAESKGSTFSFSVPLNGVS